MGCLDRPVEQYLEKDDFTRIGLAGLSSMGAAVVTNPIDVIKIRLQLDNELSDQKNIFKNRKYKGFVSGGSLILKEEGINGLYKGISASLMREGSYSSIRLGLYEPLKQVLGETNKAKTPLFKKIICGGISGTIGSAIASPTDLVKIRMQGEGPLDPGQIPRYRSTMHAFKKIARHEGALGLWRGVTPTVHRAAIGTSAQISSYDHTKHWLLNTNRMREGLPLHIVSAMMSGFITAFIMSPIDVIKTRIMNQQVQNKNGNTYRNARDCLVKTFTSEGIFGLYKGFIPNWLRLGPHTITTFILFEQLRLYIGLDPV